jgi:hypothetical protein
MNFTKIRNKDKPWLDIITEDLETSSSKPIFVLAGRFKVYRIKLHKQEHIGDKTIAFFIEGNRKKDEKAIVTLRISLQYNMVVSSTLKRALKFDSELSNYLRLSLLVRVRDMDIYHFSSKVLNL